MTAIIAVLAIKHKRGPEVPEPPCETAWLVYEMWYVASMATSHDAPYRHYLREWREFRGLLQADLASRVGCATSAISRFETGDRRIYLEMQFRLFAALNITPAQFFSPPDQPSLDALASGATPDDRRRIGNLVKAFLAGGDAE
jgi:DNA-binding XRE family transcriptional regulator